MLPLSGDALTTPIGLQEIAALLGVERATVDQWRTRGLLPTPDWPVGGRPAWSTAAITAWAYNTNRAIQIHGPGAGASNAAEWNNCTSCSVRALFEVYVDENGTVTQQATDTRGNIVCDACASLTVKLDEAVEAEVDANGNDTSTTRAAILNNNGAEIDSFGGPVSEEWLEDAWDAALEEAGYRRTGDWDLTYYTAPVVRNA